LPGKVRDAERRCPRERACPVHVGPHAIGAERFLALSSGTSFAQVAGAILGKRARGQNPDKAAGSSPARPTKQPLTSGNAAGLEDCVDSHGSVRSRRESDSHISLM
jgi:hypothetical protein